MEKTQKTTNFRIKVLMILLFLGLVAFTYLFTLQENQHSSKYPRFVGKVFVEQSSKVTELHKLPGSLRVELLGYMKSFRKMERFFKDIGGFKNSIDIVVVDSAEQVYEVSQNQIKLDVKSFLLQGQAHKAIVKSFLYQKSVSASPSLFLSEVISELILVKGFGIKQIEYKPGKFVEILGRSKWPNGLTNLIGLCGRADRPLELLNLCSSIVNQKPQQNMTWTLLSLKPVATNYLFNLLREYSWSEQIELLNKVIINLSLLDIDFGAFEVPGSNISYSLDDSKVVLKTLFQAIFDQQNITKSYKEIQDRRNLMNEKFGFEGDFVFDIAIRISEGSTIHNGLEDIVKTLGKYAEKEKRTALIVSQSNAIVLPDKIWFNLKNIKKVRSDFYVIDSCSWPDFSKLQSTLLVSNKLVWTRSCSSSQSLDFLGLLSPKPIYNFVGRNPFLELAVFDSEKLRDFKFGKFFEIGFVLTEEKMSQREIDFGVTDLEWDVQIKAYKSKRNDRPLLWIRNRIKELFPKLISSQN